MEGDADVCIVLVCKVMGVDDFGLRSFEQGADVARKDLSGLTARDLATQLKFDKIVLLLTPPANPANAPDPKNSVQNF